MLGYWFDFEAVMSCIPCRRAESPACNEADLPERGCGQASREVLEKAHYLIEQGKNKQAIRQLTERYEKTVRALDATAGFRV